MPKRLIEVFQCFAPVHGYNNKPNISNLIDGSLQYSNYQKVRSAPLWQLDIGTSEWRSSGRRSGVAV